MKFITLSLLILALGSVGCEEKEDDDYTMPDSPEDITFTEDFEITLDRGVAKQGLEFLYWDIDTAVIKSKTPVTERDIDTVESFSGFEGCSAWTSPLEFEETFWAESTETTCIYTDNSVGSLELTKISDDRITLKYTHVE